MKKTRFEKFMLAVTKKALREESLDTYGDHLRYVRLSIEIELLKSGGPEESAAIEPPKEKPSARSRVDQISSAYRKTGSALSWIYSGLGKIYVFLTKGNNFVLTVIGLLLLFAAVIMARDAILGGI